MDAARLKTLLSRLGLKPASMHTAAALGISVRQLQRMTAGQVPVPRPVALLVTAYRKWGLPDPLWDPDAEDRPPLVIYDKSRDPERDARDDAAIKQIMEDSLAIPPERTRYSDQDEGPPKQASRRPGRTMSQAEVKAIADRASRPRRSQ
jgi:hypothetical protein